MGRSALLPWLLCSLMCFGQSPAKLSFEVASIKPAPRQPMNQFRSSMDVEGSMLRYTNVSLKDCIVTAYGLKEYQIEGPGWIDSARFDIVAKLPEGSSEKQVPEMLQTLLADRFKLTLHHDSKERPIYALVVGKNGPKLKPAEVQPRDEPTPAGGAKREGPPPRASTIGFGPRGVRLRFPSRTLADLADGLSGFAERPVVDKTEIQGSYDFELEFTPEKSRFFGRRTAPPEADRPAPADVQAEQGASIDEAVQRYGLKLEPRKALLDRLIVDHVEKTPTEN